MQSMLLNCRFKGRTFTRYEASRIKTSHTPQNSRSLEHDLPFPKGWSSDCHVKFSGVRITLTLSSPRQNSTWMHLDLGGSVPIEKNPSCSMSSWKTFHWTMVTHVGVLLQTLLRPRQVEWQAVVRDPEMAMTCDSGCGGVTAWSRFSAPWDVL